MDLKELRAQTVEQLSFLISDLEKELFQLRNELASFRKLEKPHLIWAKKKLKAQALTIMSEKKRTS